MRRREFLAVLGGATAWPLAARAEQTAKIPKIGVLWHAGNEQEEAIYLAALRQGFSQLGYLEGKNFILENRFAEERYDRFDSLAHELVEANVEVLVASIVPAAFAAKRATTKIPIVVVLGGDPVGIGLANSLARPGGNLTGLSNMSAELSTKQLQILKEAIPRLSKVALLYNPKMPYQRYVTDWLVAAQTLDMSIHLVEVTKPSEFDHALSEIAEAKVEGIQIAPDGILYNNRKQLAEFALTIRLPTIAWVREMADAGALMSYGLSNLECFRRAAAYVDKILKGTSPGELPIEQPTKFEFVINLTTAKALGFSVPPSLIARADEVIE
jgi:putative tryptophan/tyrosine transport system substrate-binding protein